VNHRHWVDLDSDAAPTGVQADVCIIGAGAAGSYLAAELGRCGIDTAVLEAGGTSAVSGELAGFDPIFGRDIYPGALVGRFFGMGGSTSRWGGALVPHTVHDLRVGGAAEAAWETIVKHVNTHARTVLSRLGYETDPDFQGYPRLLQPAAAEALARAGIDIHANLMLPLRRRNLSCLWHDVPVRQRARLFLNATAKTWALQRRQNGRSMVAGLEAVSRSGRKVNVSARRYVIAAGAIESARILLEIDRASGNELFNTEAMPGRFLADHISLPIAEVVQEDRGKARDLFAPRFQGGWMRSFRFLLRSTSPAVPRGFGHFIFEKDAAGFKVAKEVVGAVQARRLPDLSVGELARGANGLAALAYDRFIKSRLHVPDGTAVRLQLDIEQRPSARNGVTLSEQLDAYGRPRAKIDWTISGDDVEAMAAVAARLLDAWPGLGGGLPRLIPLAVAGGAIKPYDAYHPTGTCRMDDGDDAVVDLDLTVSGLENLWLVSTGVLPAAGTANPTFTMLCLAQELAGLLGRCR
jgi:choline dehydrogenase-like flavoprotein